VYRLVLILLQDFPEFLVIQSFKLIEELPDNFIQLKNMILSAYPQNIPLPNPYNDDRDLEKEYQSVPPIRSHFSSPAEEKNIPALLVQYLNSQDD